MKNPVQTTIGSIILLLLFFCLAPTTFQANFFPYITSPTVNQVLTFNGTQWVNGTVVASSSSAFNTNQFLTNGIVGIKSGAVTTNNVIRLTNGGTCIISNTLPETSGTSWFTVTNTEGELTIIAWHNDGDGVTNRTSSWGVTDGFKGIILPNNTASSVVAITDSGGSVIGGSVSSSELDNIVGGASPFQAQIDALYELFPSIDAKGDFLSQTAAITNICTIAEPGMLTTYSVGAYLKVTAVTLDVIQVKVTYTDETETLVTQTFTTLAGLTSISATGTYSFSTFTIRAFNDPVVISANLTTSTGSISYDVGGYIMKIP